MSISVDCEKPGHAAGDHRDDERELDEQLAVDEVGELAPHRRRDRRRQQGRGDDPGEGGLGAVEVGDDPRQRRGDDARGQDGHEHAEEDAGQRLEHLAVGHSGWCRAVSAVWWVRVGHAGMVSLSWCWLGTRGSEDDGGGQAWAGAPRAAGTGSAGRRTVADRRSSVAAAAASSSSDQSAKIARGEVVTRGVTAPASGRAGEGDRAGPPVVVVDRALDQAGVDEGLTWRLATETSTRRACATSLTCACRALEHAEDREGRLASSRRRGRAQAPSRAGRGLKASIGPQQRCGGASGWDGRRRSYCCLRQPYIRWLPQATRSPCASVTQRRGRTRGVVRPRGRVGAQASVPSPRRACVHLDVLHVLELDALGLGDLPEHEEERQRREDRVHQVRDGRAERVQQRRERHRDEEVGDPLRGSRHAERSRPDAVGEHLAQQDPDERAPGRAEEDHEEVGGDQGDDAPRPSRVRCRPCPWTA